MARALPRWAKIYGRCAVDFAAEAIALALDDAGLNKNDIDGLLINAKIPNDVPPASSRHCGAFMLKSPDVNEPRSRAIWSHDRRKSFGGRRLDGKRRIPPR